METEIERLLRELSSAVNDLPPSRKKSLVATKIDEAGQWHERLVLSSLDWEAAAHLCGKLKEYQEQHDPPRSNCHALIELVINPLAPALRLRRADSETSSGNDGH